MEKPHQIEVTHESHYAAIRNPHQSQAIALSLETYAIVTQTPSEYHFCTSLPSPPTPFLMVCQKQATRR
jgi:hypothetical protein